MNRLIVLLCAAVMVAAISEAIKAQPKRVVAYFPEWGIEHQPYYVKDVETYGAAGKLTALIYAFSEPAPDSAGQFEPKFMNAYEAYGQVYTSSMSVDGVADDSTQALRGEFNQLKKLKRRHPNLKILISIGGWTGSGYFSDAFSTPASREKFADALIDRYILGNLPLVDGAGGRGAAAGVFDGVDIDWEYPVSGGNTGNHHNPNDAGNLTAFYALMRAKLDSINPKLLMTAAVPAGESMLANYQIKKDEKYLDWYNLMTYDFTGAWDPRTAHHANLLTSKDDPVQNSFDRTVKYFLDTLGVAGDKIVPGVAFYGRGWKDVGPKNDGLYQPADGAAPGEYEPGINNYSYLQPLLKEGYGYHWDPVAMASWLYSPTRKIFWSIDDAKSIALKYHYVDAYNLGGIMCWDISGDDSTGTLVNVMSSGTMPEQPIVGSRPGSKPYIAVTAPHIGSDLTAGSNVIINTETSDTNGSVVRVDFYVDGRSIGYDTKVPFDWVWFNVPDGKHVIKAVARDDGGNQYSSESVPISINLKR